MSDHSTPSPASSPPPAAPSESSARPFILLAILVVALGALAYDRLIARPAAEKGYQEVMKLSELRSMSARGEDSIGPAEVQAKLGKKPANTEQKDRYMIETYNWRGGALVKSHFVKVIYTGGDKPLLYTALLNEEPSEENLPTNKVISADKADPRPEGGPTAAGSPGSAGGGIVRPPTGVTPTNPDADKSAPNVTDPPAPDKPQEPQPDAEKPATGKPAADSEPKSDEPE